MKLKSKLILSALFLIGYISISQDSIAQESTVLDGIYVKEETPSRQVVPYTSLREADVLWTKRVWRRIDLQEKMNHPLYFPIRQFAQGRKNLFEVITEAILNEGTLTAYDPGDVVAPDDMFTTPMTPADVNARLNTQRLTPRYDEFGDIVGQDTIYETVEADKLKFYQIKEEWFFDKQRSVLDVRIIGILPMIEVVDEAGQTTLQDLFWIYFPEARYVFANADVFNRQNDAERRTFDDIFWKRQFSSKITKESNVYDRRIAEYKTGIDALLEAERIKNDIFNFEHDLWSF